MGESDGEVSFHVFPKQFYNSGIGGKYADWQHATKITVQQKTVDTWARENDIQRLDFIKMDIQGAELDLLQGASETINRFKPTIFLEAHDHKEQIFDLLSGYGYKINLVTDGGLKQLQKAPDVSADWLAVHD